MSTADPSNSSTTTSPAAILRQRLSDRTATIGVVGMGYVGMPLAHAVLEAGFQVLGFDVDKRKIDKLATGEVYLPHLGEAMHTELANSERFTATDDPGRLEAADVVILCVPTPLGAHREPDLTFVHQSTRMAAKVLRPGQLIVLESTTYPGTTRNEMQPLLEEQAASDDGDRFGSASLPDLQEHMNHAVFARDLLSATLADIEV